MKLYHGSNLEVREPRLLAALHTLDFGSGFYATANFDVSVFEKRGCAMNDDQFSAFLAVLVPDVVGLVAHRYGLGEAEATRRFYSSGLYAKLSDEKLKLWHYGAETLYALYEEEYRTGKITFPEEAC